MRRPDPLSHYFPLRFANQAQVTRFAKQCARCGQVVELPNMTGAVRVLPDRAMVAAKARCPKCSHEFPVTCLITQDKQVMRLHLPNTLLMWYLLATTTAPVAQAPVPAATAVDLQRLQRSEVEVAADSVGQFDGQPIPAWIRHGGEQFDFEGVLGKGQQPARDERVLDGQLLYRRHVLTA